MGSRANDNLSNLARDKACMVYIFDIDGTLTPSRGQIDPDFQQFMLDFAKQHTVMLVTGSDHDKSIEQLGPVLWAAADYSFNCAGNEIYRRGQLVHRSDWTCPADLWRYLESHLLTSLYRHRAGRHFEIRTGMLNFSVVGRNAKEFDRRQYYEWDLVNQERELLCAEINRRWLSCHAVVGGETGIDIFPRGHDKAQVLSWLPDQAVIEFFGDRMDTAGNDYSLAQAILTSNRGQCYHVRDWKHTWQLLMELA